VSVTKLEVAGIDLELFDSGSGAPLLFLHGAGGFAPNHPYVAPLSAKHRLIAPSHPGFGASDLPDWLDRPDDIAHIHLELLDRLKLKQVDMIGCSVGGWIAAEMASMAPERFKRLVMVGPVGIKVGPADKLDIPDIFAMPAADVAKITHHDPAKMTPDMSKMADEQMAVMFRNRETLALLVWEPLDAQSQAQALAAPDRMPGAVHSRCERRSRLRCVFASLREAPSERAHHDHPGRRPRAAHRADRGGRLGGAEIPRRLT
jgi:pimeloyl-ACP methyl ester carboxylesterase